MHWLFRYSCGCSFSVMTQEHHPTEPSAWFEAFDTAVKVRAARDEGVFVELISHAEWEAEHRDQFGQCSHGTVLESLSRNDEGDPDLEQMAIDRAVENQLDAYWEGVYALLDDETSQMWKAFAEVVEKLQPEIGPWDRREMVAAIVAEFKAVVEDA
jgi:hypothetical protein